MTTPLLSLLFGCTSPVSPNVLTLAGSSTIQPLAEVAAEAFEKAHPGVQIDVQGGGSGVGVTAARSGLADIGMVSRSLKQDEADLVATRFARDGIAIVAHASNPISGLTSAQVKDIWSGAAPTWEGGARMTVVNKEEGRSTRELFEHHFGLAGLFRKDLVVIGPNGQAITTVAGDPAAVAYVSIGSATVAEESGTPIRRLALDGIPASVAAVEDGSYPLARDLLFVTKGEPAGLARDFLDFVRSPEGQALVAKEDFVPLPRTHAAL